jgi:ferric-dicitrate binding protein FerR (iron transport regulator)
MTDIFIISKLIVKKKLNILTASEKLQLIKFDTKYPFIKDIKIEDLVAGVEIHSKINKEKAWKSIENKTQKKIDKPVAQFFNKKWYKYAATIAIILTSVYFLSNSLFNDLDIKNAVIVETKTIQPGTDKATLTLSDGSKRSLEKGKTISTNNANSNGEKIVYLSNLKKPSTVTYNYLTIPRGGQFFIELSDGTKVWLNSESQLKYPVAFLEGKTREVELVYGEAYFDITPSLEYKGSKFRVINKSQEIEVLGTEFNVKAYRDESTIYTTLVEGSVAIEFENTKKKLLPKQQSRFNLSTKDFEIMNVDIYNEISWKDGVFSFERKPLKEIMKVLSRWYDIKVVFENKSLEEVKFFGVLYKEQDINEILQTIKKFKIIESYEINNKTILLK